MAARGTGHTRHYIHDDAEARALRCASRHIHRLGSFEPGTNVLFYEGLHGAS